MSAEPTIVLIGVNSEVCQIIRAYLDRKFNIKIFARDFEIKTLDRFENIVLFIMDTDQFTISIDNTVLSIKSHPLYQNIPLLGMAIKQHFGKIPMQHRNLYDDIILTPLNYEDLLIRIDVWINTYQHLSKSLIASNLTFIQNDEKLNQFNPIEY
jgi:hypothetical protein